MGGGAGGFLGSLVPIATWLNPHSTTGLAVEVSKFVNIQYRGTVVKQSKLSKLEGRQYLASRFVAMGMSVEDPYRVQGIN